MNKIPLRERPTVIALVTAALGCFLVPGCNKITSSEGILANGENSSSQSAPQFAQAKETEGQPPHERPNDFPGGDSAYNDSLTRKPIPNAWFLDNKLPLSEKSVCLKDPDGDGFPNEVEWRWKTNPNDKNSHPPYYAMLFLKQMLRIPFRLKFGGYKGNPTRDKIGDVKFLIDTIDLKQPPQFLKIGDTVSGTHFKLEAFEFKMARNSNTGDDDDVSEITVVNTETTEKAVLTLNLIRDCPTYYALFDYQWPQPSQPPAKPSQFVVKEFGTFVLQPSVQDVYKLVGVDENAAEIQLPKGQRAPDGSDKVEITRDPRKR